MVAIVRRRVDQVAARGAKQPRRGCRCCGRGPLLPDTRGHEAVPALMPPRARMRVSTRAWRRTWSPQQRASGACRSPAKAPVKAVAGPEPLSLATWRRTTTTRPNPALLLSPNLDSPPPGVRTIAFILRGMRLARSRWRHSDHQGSSCGADRRCLCAGATEATCIGSRAFLHGAVSALHSASCALPAARRDGPGVAGFVREQKRGGSN